LNGYDDSSFYQDYIDKQLEKKWNPIIYMGYIDISPDIST
jgi:hypothetical protein